MATSYLESIVFEFLDNKLTDDEKKQIHSAYDCEKEIDEESEDEMRYALYKYVFNNIAWWKIIGKLKEGLEDSDDEKDSSDEEED